MALYPLLKEGELIIEAVSGYFSEVLSNTYDGIVPLISTLSV
jgi:hypothetical protein